MVPWDLLACTAVPIKALNPSWSKLQEHQRKVRASEWPYVGEDGSSKGYGRGYNNSISYETLENCTFVKKEQSLRNGNEVNDVLTFDMNVLQGSNSRDEARP